MFVICFPRADILEFARHMLEFEELITAALREICSVMSFRRMDH